MTKVITNFPLKARQFRSYGKKLGNDIMKEAMVKASKYLIDVRAKTRLLLTVHDELICEYPVGEEHHLIEIRNIMTRAYTHKSLPLTAGIDISSKSWFDKEEL